MLLPFLNNVKFVLLSSGEDPLQSVRLDTNLPLSDSKSFRGQYNYNSSFLLTLNSEASTDNMKQPLSPPVYFTGYILPPGNPCETFTLPPPPADKKRTGPRRKFDILPIYVLFLLFK